MTIILQCLLQSAKCTLSLVSTSQKRKNSKKQWILVSTSSEHDRESAQSDYYNS